MSVQLQPTIIIVLNIHIGVIIEITTFTWCILYGSILKNEVSPFDIQNLQHFDSVCFLEDNGAWSLQAKVLKQ